MKARPRIPKTGETVDRRQNNGSVKRRCPLAIAQRLVHCATAVSTAVFGQSHKDNVRCTDVEEQPEAKEVQLSQPSSTSLLMISSGLRVQLHLPTLDLTWNPGNRGMCAPEACARIDILSNLANSNTGCLVLAKISPVSDLSRSVHSRRVRILFAVSTAKEHGCSNAHH